MVGTLDAGMVFSPRSAYTPSRFFLVEGRILNSAPFFSKPKLVGLGVLGVVAGDDGEDGVDGEDGEEDEGEAARSL